MTCKALALAHETQGKPQLAMFHSDQGCQYSSEMFRTKLESLGIQQSVSRRGNCWDPDGTFFWKPEARMDTQKGLSERGRSPP
ncbi:DDE-type integrase/transposase/recombinase [Pseudomonas syringae]|uniref:DDE-type integrase/transposase/recombinase n=1 Tax=Pseudomonas syringae TaxID=317 RepID=UPI003C12BBE0